ncbi:hypothetical protein JW930_00375 [Candidatus Woesearchaeota archaeon]|nr:hypothetical protein [Candidatus Woesearchaeota archaeon]
MGISNSVSKSNAVEIIICKHCRRKIEEKAIIEGFSIICPHCGKPL